MRPARSADLAQKRKKSAGAGASSGDPAQGGDDSMTPEFKRGGKVKRTGLAKVHKGEEVLTSSQARKYRRGKKR